MKFQTITDLKKNAANLPLQEPTVITKQGKPVFVIESFAERKARDEAIALLKLLCLSSKDIEAGRVMSKESFRERLSLKKHNAQSVEGRKEQ